MSKFPGPGKFSLVNALGWPREEGIEQDIRDDLDKR